MFETGVCGCHGYDLTQGDDYVKIFETMVFMKELMLDTDEDTKRKLVAALCSSKINDGDHLQVRGETARAFSRVMGNLCCRIFKYP